VFKSLQVLYPTTVFHNHLYPLSANAQLISRNSKSQVLAIRKESYPLTKLLQDLNRTANSLPPDLSFEPQIPLPLTTTFHPDYHLFLY